MRSFAALRTTVTQNLRTRDGSSVRSTMVCMRRTRAAVASAGMPSHHGMRRRFPRSVSFGETNALGPVAWRERVLHRVDRGAFGNGHRAARAEATTRGRI